MWFGKWPKWFAGRPNWFTGREDDTDEPARHVAPAIPKTSHTEARQAPAARQAKSAPAKGFDPYNSGSFERRNAWERVGRR